MATVLAENEVVLKSWDYAKAGNRFDRHKRQRTLTVTNKRIINSSESTFELTHDEIPLSAVKAVHGDFRKNDGLWMKIKFACAVIFSILIVGLLFGSLGKAMRLHREIKSCVFHLTITTSGLEGESFNVGAAPETGIQKRKHFFSKTVNKVKIYTDKEIARDIVDTIGSFAYQKEA